MFKYMETPKQVMETKIGNVLIWCNGEDSDGRNVYGTATRSGIGDPVEADEFVTVNRVECTVHEFFTVKNGDIALIDRFSTTTLRRCDTLQPPSDSANTKAQKILMQALEDFLTTPEGENFTLTGNRIAANNAAVRAQEDLIQAQRKLEAADAAMAAAQKRVDRYLSAPTNPCPGEHRVTQHRDARPPWCNECGRDNEGNLHREPKGKTDD